MALFFVYLAMQLGFVPYRQILRLEGFYHLSLLEMVLAFLIGTFFLKYLKYRSVGNTRPFFAAGELNLPFVALIGAFAFAAGLGLIRQPRSSWNNVFRMATVGLEYAMFFFLMREIRDARALRALVRVLVVFSVLAVAFVLVFQVKPALLPATSEMGVATRESFSGLRRVFTPGSGLILAVALTLLSCLVGSGESFPLRWRPLGWLLGIVLLLALVPSFVRSLFITIAFWLLVLTLRRLRSSRQRLRTVVTIGVSLAVLYGAASAVRTPSGATLFDAVVARTVSVRSLGQEGQLNTLATRLLEVAVAAQEMRSKTDHLVGLGFGHMYSYSFPPEEYQASVTHNGYFSIYYSHGILGSLLWLYFLVAVSRRVLANQAALKGTSRSDFHFGVLMVWFSILLANVQAPALQSSGGPLLLVVVVVLSERIRTFGLLGRK